MLPLALGALLLMAEPGPMRVKGPTPEAEQQKARDLAAEAKARSDAHEHVAAAELLLKAVSLHWHPPYTFGAAQEFERGGDVERAIEHYRHYVLSTGAPDPKLMKQSQERIRALEAAKKTDAGH